MGISPRRANMNRALLCPGIWLGVFLSLSFLLQAIGGNPDYHEKYWPLYDNVYVKPGLKLYQSFTLGLPPLPPSQFNPDPKTSAFPPRLFEEEIVLQLS